MGGKLGTMSVTRSRDPGAGGVGEPPRVRRRTGSRAAVLGAITIVTAGALEVRAAGLLGTGEWIDTRAKNSLRTDDRLFEAIVIEGEDVAITRSRDTNIHSHLVLSAPVTMQEITGEMMVDEAKGGAGVTFLSRYPLTDHYYRLRRYDTKDFELSPHGTTVSGDTRSGVVPRPNTWYRFRVRVTDDSTRTSILARVWPAGSSEPSDWQIDCFDETSTRLVEGTVGLWSMGPGRKLWRRLVVDGARVPFDSRFATPDLVSSDGTRSDGGASAPSEPDLTDLTDPTDPTDPTDGSSSDPVATIPPAVTIHASEDRDSSGAVRITFTADISDPDSVIASDDVRWNFGDGSEGQGLAIAHVYPVAGTYSVAVSVRDESGNVAEDQVEVAVLDAPSPDGVRWVDTRARNSMTEDDTLFVPGDLDSGPVFLTRSTETNIHSHALTGDEWSSLSFRGRFRVEDARGGVGVTFLSDYPNSDRYYRLRRYNELPFHIAPHGTTITGDADTGVVPVAGRWYDFAVEVVVGTSATTVRAKVWLAGTTEPASWQADCRDASSTRLRTGTVGCWSMGPGVKYWSSFRVNGVALPFSAGASGVPTSLSVDQGFDDSTSITLGAGPYSLATEPGAAYAGEGALEVDIGASVRTADLFPGPFLDVFAPFIFADQVFASARVRLDAAANWDVSSLSEALDELLAARPDALTAEETAIARQALERLEGSAAALHLLESGQWYCLGIACFLPEADGTPGRFSVLLDGVPVLVLDGVSVPEHAGLLTTMAALLRHRALVSEANTLWLDELVVSTEPVACR